MRVLVVAEDAEVRAARARDLDRAGHEAAGASDAAHVTARVRAERPDALLVVASGTTSELRLLLSRARAAAEASLPAVVLLDDTSVWLRAPLPQDLAPAVALAAHQADGSRIADALSTLLAGPPGTVRGATARIGGMTLDHASHRLTGPAREVRLTPSEHAVLSLLAGAPGTFVSAADLARALWGDALTDRHARGAIRSHVHTLRGKLAAAGLDGVVESRSGVGYRLVLEATSAD